MKPQSELERLYCITIGEQGNIEAYDMDTGEVVHTAKRQRIRKPKDDAHKPHKARRAPRG